VRRDSLEVRLRSPASRRWTFPRICNAKLDRFTIDRLMTILSCLRQKVEVTVNGQPRRAGRGGIELRP
jgi:hypothetical protein